MKYLLDTNTCIRFLNQRSTAIINKMKSMPDSDIAVCLVVKAELFYGAARSSNPTTTLAKQKYFLQRFISLPFDDTAAEIYGGERGRLTALGTPIGPNDNSVNCPCQ